MNPVCALGGLALILRTASQPIADTNPFDHEYPVLEHDVTLGFRAQSSTACIDLARLQRTPECACKSTCSRCYHVVERGGMIGVLARSCPVVFANLIMRAEQYRVGLAR